MPLTLPTHPIAVVPLKLWRPRWFVGVALTLGAIAPDLAYATYGLGVDLRTHNVPATVWWALPVTLILARLVRWAAPAVAAHLPGGGVLRLGDYAVLGAVRHRWHVTAVSAILGAGSHIAWDAVTHPGYLSSLRREARPGTPWWGMFSDASNVAGFVLGALLIVHIGRAGLVRRWHGPPPCTTRRPVAFWSAAVAAVVSGLTAVLARPVDWAAAQAIRAMLITGLALLCGAAAARWAPQRSRARLEVDAVMSRWPAGRICNRWLRNPLRPGYRYMQPKVAGGVMEFGTIERELYIEAAPEVVYEVVSDPRHVKQWWPDDARYEPAPGASGEIFFAKGEGEAGGTAVAFTVVEAQPPWMFSFRWTHPAGTPAAVGN
jgi:hypothetical protein